MDLPRELHDAICRDPEDQSSMQVAADWLQERGDPRGELIALELAREAGDVDPTLVERAQQLGADLDPFDPTEGWIVDWRWGHVRRAQRYAYLGDDQTSAWRRLLTSESGRFARELVDQVNGDLFHQLLLETPPIAVRALATVGNHQLAAVVTALPHLARLRLLRNPNREPLRAPKLTELAVTLTDLAEVDWLSQCDLPLLARLRLELEMRDPDRIQLDVLDRFPRLSELILVTRTATVLAAAVTGRTDLRKLDRVDVISSSHGDERHPRHLIIDQLRPEHPMLAAILIIQGRSAGSLLAFDKPIITLGRGPAADIHLDPVTRDRYATLEHADDTWHVVPGATVNGVLTTRCELRHGDELAFGNTTLRFLTHDITATAARLRRDLGLPARRPRRPRRR